MQKSTDALIRPAGRSHTSECSVKINVPDSACGCKVLGLDSGQCFPCVLRSLQPPTSLRCSPSEGLIKVQPKPIAPAQHGIGREKASSEPRLGFQQADKLHMCAVLYRAVSHAYGIIWAFNCRTRVQGSGISFSLTVGTSENTLLPLGLGAQKGPVTHTKTTQMCITWLGL